MDNPKLFFLVKKILSSSEPGNQYNNFDPSNSHVVNELVYVNLLKNHREYQRKNQSALKKAIEIAVGTVISNSTPLGSTVKVSTPTALAPKHKRRREEEEEEEEGGIPSTETMPKGRIPTTTTTGNGNMLNATLCANYQEIQKKKEQQSLLSILEEEQAEEVNTDTGIPRSNEVTSGRTPTRFNITGDGFSCRRIAQFWISNRNDLCWNLSCRKCKRI